MPALCLCGAPLVHAQIPVKQTLCSRTNRTPCANAPLADVPLTFDQLQPLRVEAYRKLLDAQDAVLKAAADYADICYRSAIAPRTPPAPPSNLLQGYPIINNADVSAAPISQADGSAS